MKQLYFFLCITISSMTFAQYGEISNGGFENWTTNTLYEYLTQWGNSNVNEYGGIPTIAKSTDAQLGMYSCEMMVELGPMNDTNISYVFQGTVGQMGPDTGIPYSSVFDEVRFQYKSDLPAGDTVYLLYMRFLGGSMIEAGTLPAIYGTVSTWTQGSISVPNTVQDSLFIGFVTGNPFAGPLPTPGGWARIDNVEMYNLGSVTTALPDPSFEDWTAQTVESVDDWFTMNEMLAGAGLENATKTTDANTGSFALELVTQENSNQDTIPGFISLAPMNFGGPGNPFALAPYNANPTDFSGAYKYTPGNGDQAWIEIEFFQAGGSLGYHYIPLNAAATWTTINTSLTITGTPDSVRFVATSGFNPTSVLLLDDLQFSGGNVGIEEFETLDFTIYPNPANDKVYIKSEGVYSVVIYDLLGAVVYEKDLIENAVEIDLLGFEQGTYVVVIENDSNKETHKLIVE